LQVFTAIVLPVRCELRSVPEKDVSRQLVQFRICCKAQ
jgi:hypothetical protein